MPLPPDFAFACPLKINCGRAALAHLPAELAAMGARTPLVLANGSRLGRGRVKQVVNAFAGSGLTIGLYDRVGDQVQPDMLPPLVRLVDDRGCDSLVAVGGAATVDLAKCLRVHRQTGLLERFDEEGRCQTDPGPLLPLMMVPTPGGDGREATGRAWDGRRHFRHQRLMPDVALIDPAMMTLGDRTETVAGALTGLVQATESLLDEGMGPMGHAWARTAVMLIGNRLPRVLRNQDQRTGLSCLVNGQVAAACAAWNAPEGICQRLGSALQPASALPAGYLMAMLLLHRIHQKNVVSQQAAERLLLPLAGMETAALTAEQYKVSRIRALLWELLEAVNAEIDDPIAFSLDQAGIGEQQVARILAQQSDETAVRLLRRAQQGSGEHIAEAQPSTTL